MANPNTVEVLKDGQLAVATTTVNGTIISGRGDQTVCALVQTDEGDQLALKVFPLDGGGSSVVIVPSLPLEGDSRYLYGVLMDDLDREGYGIIQFFVWYNNAWYATGAYSIDIDPNTLMYKDNFSFNTSTGVLNIIVE